MLVRPTQFRPFRIGNRRKPSTAKPTTRSPLTTSSPSPFSRPTKITRRKYLPQTTKSVESQGTVTTKPKIETRFRFVPRRPLTRTTTPKAKDETTEVIRDQALESSNQQSLEEDFEGGKTTELADIAIALQNIQLAPLPTLSHLVTQHPPSPTTLRVVSNEASLSQTTSRITSGRPTRTRVKYSTTSSPLFLTTTKPTTRDHRPRPFEKSNPSNSNIFHPLSDYDYYDDNDSGVLGRIPEHSKVLLHSNGVIECLDQGSFPHPVSCKKFISCAKMENGKVLGWEYTCPKNLSFDPIGGMCNWSAGLGCNE